MIIFINALLILKREIEGMKIENKQSETKNKIEEIKLNI